MLPEQFQTSLGWFVQDYKHLLFFILIFSLNRIITKTAGCIRTACFNLDLIFILLTTGNPAGNLKHNLHTQLHS